MGIINWNNVTAPSLDSAVRLVADAYANKQKALGDLIGVGSEFAKNVQQANHDDIKNYIDSLSRDELKNKETINTKVNELGGNWFGYDKGVVNTYLDSRVPIMNTRTVDDITTQNTVDKDNIDRLTANVMPLAIRSNLNPNDTDTIDSLTGALMSIKNPYYKARVQNNVQTQAPKNAFDMAQNFSGIDKIILDKDLQSLDELVKQAYYYQSQLKTGDNLSNQDVSSNNMVTDRLTTLLKNPLVQKYYGEFNNRMYELTNKRVNDNLNKLKTEVGIEHTNANTNATNASVVFKGKELELEAQKDATNNQNKQDRLTVEAFEKQKKEKIDSAVKSGFTADVINDDLSINKGALKEHYNQLLRGVEVSEYGQDVKHKTLSSYLADPAVVKMIQNQDHLTSGWGDVITPNNIADSDRLNKLQVELNSSRHNGKPLPEWLKIGMAEKLITNPSIFTLGSDTGDIQKFVKNELAEYDKNATAYRENLYRTKVVDFWEKAIKLGVPASELVMDLGITSKSKEFPYLTKDLQGVILLHEQGKDNQKSMVGFGLGQGGNSFKPTIKENSPTNNTVSGKTKYDIALEKINKGVKLNKEASEKLYKEYQKGEITQQEYLATLTKIRNTHQSLVNSYKQLGVKP